jgi:AcrR family transcriptional regulator
LRVKAVAIQLDIVYYIEMARVKRRRYESQQRRAGAERTRRHILAAARRLFVARSYGETTIEAIARGARVAAPTVFAVFGSKRAILFALLDRMAAAADPGRLHEAIAGAAGDPRRQLRAQIAFNTRFYAAGIDLIEIARTVSGAEPDFEEMWREGESRRHRAEAVIVQEWARAGALAPGLSGRAATDLLWALSGPDMFRLLVVEQGWSRRRFEARLAALLERSLFRTD